MNRQYNKMNYQYSRDLTANGSANGNRVERASNWGPMNSRDGNYRSADNSRPYTSRGPPRPQNTSRNGPSSVNRPSKPPIKRPAPSSTKSRLGPEPPGLGEPGGLDDPLRKGLSGAGTKWYWRFLAEGWKPEVARQMAEERRQGPPKTTGPPMPKRAKLMNPAKPSEAASTVKTKAPAIAPAVRNKLVRPLKVAVLPAEYPRVTLKPEELDQLEEAIIDEVTLGHDKKIHFAGVEHRPNMLVIECKDWAASDWLREKLPKLSGWKGAPLIGVLEYKLVTARNIRVFLPRSSGKTHEQLLTLIKAQNEGLRTERWSIKSAIEENDGQLLTIAIDGFSFKAIGRNNDALCYRYGTIPVVKLEETDAEPAKETAAKEEDKHEEGDAVDGEGDAVDGDEVDETVEGEVGADEVDENVEAQEDEEEVDGDNVEINEEDETL